MNLEQMLTDVRDARSASMKYDLRKAYENGFNELSAIMLSLLNALAFYADRESWKPEDEDSFADIIVMTDVSVVDDEFEGGGFKARIAIKDFAEFVQVKQ